MQPLSDSSIKQSLETFKERLNSALEDDAAALNLFISSWNSFAKRVETCHPPLEGETTRLVNAFKATVDSVAETLLDLHPDEAVSIVNHFSDDINNLLARDSKNKALITDSTAVPPSESLLDEYQNVVSYVKLESNRIAHRARLLVALAQS